jgi:hypothetical protein
MKPLIITLGIASVVATIAVIGLHHGQKVTSARASVVESSPEQTQPEKVVAPNQNGLGTVGFVYGLAAISQVSKLKKEVEELKKNVENLKPQIDPKS